MNWQVYLIGGLVLLLIILLAVRGKSKPTSGPGGAP
jgi:hypothetical protein